MNEYQIKILHEAAINRIWEKHRLMDSSVLDRGYCLPESLVKDSILFVGINPSFDVKKDKRGSFFYPIVQTESGNKYFNKFPAIAQELGLPWSHLDLLYFRNTAQKYVGFLVGNKNPACLDFINEQLAVSKQIIEGTDRKSVV